jgi:hypothetical protein
MSDSTGSESAGFTQRLEGLADIQRFLVDLVSAVHTRLSVLTQALEPELFDNDDMTQRLAHFARANTRNSLRVITCDTTRAEQRGHRLVTLAQQLPSYVHIRLLPPEIRQAYPQAQRTSVLADDCHALIWTNTQNPVANAYWHRPGLLRPDLRNFDTLWEQCQSVVAFRRLGI